MLFTNFETAKKYGEIGESLFVNNIYNKLFKEYKFIYDVRNYRVFQLVDCDYIISKEELDLSNEIKQLNIIDELRKHYKDNIKDCKFLLIEIKTDGVIKRTSNIVLEFTAKDKVGWFGKISSDFIIYVPTDEKMNLIGYYWIINTIKLRSFLGENAKIINKDKNVRFNYFIKKEDEVDSHCLNLLVNIDYLVSNKIANKYKIKEKE